MKNKTIEHHCLECRPGMVMSTKVKAEERTQPDGVTKYWIVTQPIGSLFGSPVEGECVGIGATQEQALERLRENTQKLYESIWY